MTPSDEADLTLEAVCRFLESPPEDPRELERQRFNLNYQTARLMERVEREKGER